MSAADWSFEKFNYSLRPNKNVERKLMLDVLSAFGQSPRFDITGYRYLGFSSVYYTDIILFHKRLGIDDFVSIEKADTRRKRLEFNKPYSCIEVKIGHSSEVLPKLDWTGPQFVWLDYDSVMALSMFADVQTTLSNLKSRDFIFITVDAELKRLQNTKIDDRELTPFEALSQLAPENAIPPDADERLTGVLFPGLLGQIWADYLSSAVLSSASGLRFMPLMNLTYADGARMVTYGGVLLNDQDRGIVEELGIPKRFDYLTAEQFELAVPPLTHKEKLELDRLMPAGTAPKSSALPFELKQSEIEAYWRFYRHYPTYGELGP